METRKVKLSIGDEIHVKILLADNRCCVKYYGRVLDERVHPESLFPNRIYYEVELDQIDAPPIRITNLPQGLVLAGGPEMDEE